VALRDQTDRPGVILAKRESRAVVVAAQFNERSNEKSGDQLFAEYFICFGVRRRLLQ
jgi:hypothetical protein